MITKKLFTLMVMGLLLSLSTVALAAGKEPVFPEGFKIGNFPITPAVKAQGLIFLSGQIPMDANGKMPEGIVAQVKQCMENIKGVLAASGSDLTKVVKVTIYLKDLNHFDEVNKTYASYFPNPKDFPARTAIQVARIPADALVEIEMVAVQ